MCVIYIWFGTFVVIQMSLNRLIHWHFIYSTRTAYQCHEIFYSRFFWVETFYLGPPYEQAKTVLQTFKKDIQLPSLNIVRPVVNDYVHNQP